MIVGLLGRAAGLRVDDAEALEAAYAGPSTWLWANFVVALDGAVEVDGASGALGGPADREVFATLRALADVVLVGAGTVRSEGYGPAWLAPARRARRAGRGQAPLPVVAVVTASAALDPGSKLFTMRRDDQPDPPRPIVLTVESAAPECRRRLEPVAEVVVCGDQALDLRVAVEHLRAAGLARIGCEGGPALFGDLVALGLVDELCCTHAPVLGGPGHRTLSGGAAGARAPLGFELTDLLADGSVLFGRYRQTGLLTGAAP